MQVVFATGQLSMACSLKCTVASLIPRLVYDCRILNEFQRYKRKKELLFVTTTDTIYFEIIKNVPCRMVGWGRVNRDSYLRRAGAITGVKPTSFLWKEDKCRKEERKPIIKVKKKPPCLFVFHSTFCCSTASAETWAQLKVLPGILWPDKLELTSNSLGQCSWLPHWSQAQWKMVLSG